MKILRLWGLTREQLHMRTRSIWENDFRPGNSEEEIVGSGFDTANGDEK